MRIAGWHPLDEVHHRLDSEEFEKNTTTSTIAFVQFIAEASNEEYDALHVPQAACIDWTTVAHDRDELGRYCSPLEEFDDEVTDDGGGSMSTSSAGT